MTFNYTDKQLNNLNRDNGVYSVNSEFARRKHKKLVVNKPDSELASYETNTITTLLMVKNSVLLRLGLTLKLFF